MIVIFALSVLLLGIGIGLRLSGAHKTRKPMFPEQKLHEVRYREMDLPVEKINAN